RPVPFFRRLTGDGRVDACTRHSNAAGGLCAQRPPPPPPPPPPPAPPPPPKPEPPLEPVVGETAELNEDIELPIELMFGIAPGVEPTYDVVSLCARPGACSCSRLSAQRSATPKTIA